MIRHLTAPSFKVGDKVWVPVYQGRTCGTVVEDRGNLGVGGRRLFRVRTPAAPYESSDYLLGEDEMQHLSESEQRDLQTKLPPDEVKEFLIKGGLLLILVQNRAEPVWLLRNLLGNLTFTYEEGYSVTGGYSPPLRALYGEKIAAAARERVVEFIKTFGLSDRDAEEVVKAVGVGPQPR